MEWLEKHIFPLERQLNDRMVYLSALLGCAEMIRVGTTAFQDMYFFEDAVCRATDLSGLCCLAGEGIFSFPTPSAPTPEEGLRLTRELAARWKDHPRIYIAVAPHTVYTTTPELLRRCMDLAEELDAPLHMHLAESVAERIVEAATKGGAHALRLPGSGELAEGAPADLIALDLDAPNLRPLYSPLSHAVYAATGMEVILNMTAGEILYQDGCFTRFNYAELLAEIDAARKAPTGKLRHHA